MPIGAALLLLAAGAGFTTRHPVIPLLPLRESMTRNAGVIVALPGEPDDGRRPAAEDASRNADAAEESPWGLQGVRVWPPTRPVVAVRRQNDRAWAHTRVQPGGRRSSEEQDDEARRRRRQSTAMRVERIAKFLNLFTVIQFLNAACESGSTAGTCFHHLQCRSLGGRPTAPCAQGYGVCCLIEKTCGETAQLNSTYFVNPPYDPRPPGHSDRSDGYSNCFLTVVKLNEEITQLRLDFEHFELAAPTNGTCAEERFVVISPDRNAPVPALCGGNTGQHMYVQVATAPGQVRLGVQRLGGPMGGGRWAVRVTQLRPQDPLAAAPGCLQLHAGHAGHLRSFGWLGPQPGYTNNLNYAICIRKETGFCTITYSARDPNGADLPFQLLNADQDGSPTIPPGQAGAEIFNCPDDYIVVNGIRLCGDRLNDASTDPDYTHNAPVTDSGSGPFVLPVRTNENFTGRGFDLSYRQNPCSEAREVQVQTRQMVGRFDVDLFDQNDLESVSKPLHISDWK